jgi:predicted GH43/DUF377 family glycosyl hydrolase
MFIRSKLNPILKPDKDSFFESLKVYNPGVIFNNGQYHLFYRAVGGAWVSKIAHAHSLDGENFVKFNEIVLDNEEKNEKNGVEDPRITQIEGKCYMTYTAYDGECARLSLASAYDFLNWEKHGLMIKNWDARKAGQFLVPWDKVQNNKVAEKEWIKAGGIFSEKIQDNYYMLFGDRNIYFAKSKNIFNWKADLKPFLKPRKGYFDSVHLEMGPPPIKTLSGWLVLYHGIDENKVYRLGYVLLDLKNPQKIIYRSDQPIFEPTEAYEISGLVDILPGGFSAMEKMSEEELKKYVEKAKNNHTMPSVIFCNGAVLRDGILRIYYGAGDSVVCMASCEIRDLLRVK